ncbi:hypothetical protein FOA52_015971 [Chlamydomonas sp. UWO 241]|nr:hypothetical protein FOA52_015971 [Chlamydomonas sp. UWO 241]
MERAGHAAVVDGKYIFVVGGRKGRAFNSDVLRYDTAKRTWLQLLPSGAERFSARANHTATLIGRDIWVVGGSNNDAIFSDVCVLNLDRNAWRFPVLKDPTQLICRSAHAADVHPRNPNAVLIMGGYGGMGASYVWLDDTIVLYTDRAEVECAFATGTIPSPRGYHSLTTLGHFAYVIGGRTDDGRICGRQLVAVYDASTNTWCLPELVGEPPQARSSHRAVALPDRIVLHGGARAENDPDRLSDAAALMVGGVGGHHGRGAPRLEWLDWHGPQVGRIPTGRAAHTVSMVGSMMYVICGYSGASGVSKYVSDVWALDLPLHVERCGGPGVAPQSTQARDDVPFITKPTAARGSAAGLGPGSERQQQQQQQHRGAAKAPGSPPLDSVAASGAGGAGAGAAGTKRGARSPLPGAPGAKRPSGGGGGGSAGGAGPSGRTTPPPASPARGGGGGSGTLGGGGAQQQQQSPRSPPGGRAAAAAGAAGGGAPASPQHALGSGGNGSGRPSPPPSSALALVSDGLNTAQLQQKVAALEAELSKLKALSTQQIAQQHYHQYQLLEYENKRLRSDLSLTVEQRNAATDACQVQNTSAKNLAAELQELRGAHAQLQQTCAAATASASAASALQAEVTGLMTKLAERSADLETERARSRVQQETLTSTGNNLAATRERLAAEERTLLNARREADTERSARREAESALEGVRANLRSTETKLSTADDELRSSRSETQELGRRVRAAEDSARAAGEARRSLEVELSSVRAQIAAHRVTAGAANDFHRQVEALAKNAGPAFAALASASGGGSGALGSAGAGPSFAL